MKNILVTGADGYIGRNIVKFFEKFPNDIRIVKTTHKTEDLRKLCDVNKIFEKEYFDWVIHCAGVGGRKNYINEDSYQIYSDNMKMFNNILTYKNHFNKLISFGSGAEFDRSKHIIDSLYLKEKPKDNYGASKYDIAKLIEKYNYYNIRLFGVFSEDEADDRFIKANLIRYINKMPMIIHQNKYMDFIAMEDLLIIIYNYIFNDDVLKFPVHLNAVYEEKITLYEICNYINGLSNYKVDYIINKEGSRNTYTGLFNNKLMKYFSIEADIESIYYRIRKMYKNLKEGI